MKHRAQHVTEKYLRSVERAETLDAERLEERYKHVVVVPAYAEGSLNAMLAAFERAACARTLCILVVNEPPNARAEMRDATQETLRWCAEQGQATDLGDGRTWRGAAGPVDLLVVERTHRTAPLREDQGVGAARAIGANLALSLIAQGVIEIPYICNTDCDAVVPGDYFTRLHDQQAGALLYPFAHRTDGRDASGRDASDEGASDGDAAIVAYESSLRYYVEGLRHAGSPYAFHTIGSCIAVRAPAYAQVRGFPRRSAGEDFYLLNKVRKVAPVESLRGEPIRLSARVSTRTPFGTGQAVGRFDGAKPGAYPTYDPRCFEVVRQVRAFAHDASLARSLESHLQAHLPTLEDVLLPFCRVIEDARARAKSETQSEAAFHRHIDTFLDAFKTLKLVHHVTEHGLPKRRLEDALASAPFLEPSHRSLRGLRRLQGVGQKAVEQKAVASEARVP